MQSPGHPARAYAPAVPLPADSARPPVAQRHAPPIHAHQTATSRHESSRKTTAACDCRVHRSGTAPASHRATTFPRLPRHNGFHRPAAAAATAVRPATPAARARTGPARMSGGNSPCPFACMPNQPHRRPTHPVHDQRPVIKSCHAGIYDTGSPR